MVVSAGATRTLRAILLVVLGTTSALAQGRTTRRVDNGHGGFQIGTMSLDLGDLNAALTGAGYPALKEQFLTLGGAGYGVIGRWLIGGEGHAFIGPEETTTSGLFDVAATGGYGMFRVGYNLLVRPDFDLYPTIGFGGGATQIQIRGRGTPTFGDILTNPARSSRLSSSGFVLGAGISANARLDMSDPERANPGGLMVGLTAGYVMSPASSSWRLDEVNSVGGGPDVLIQGFYVRFTLGGWGKPKE